ncbi:MAG: glucose-1-phosphate adenylyltransferase [Burkholderiaceae bacterium]|nr:glucose-1-phosphate adenylyltransferase [Burkholderiaceae bacterium]
MQHYTSHTTGRATFAMTSDKHSSFASPVQLNAPTESLRHLTQQTYALVLAGGRGSRLMQLTDWRAKPAMPFAGKLKIIDFPLSNCVNSGIRRVGVLTQYKAQSLIRHIERGWGFLEASLGEYIDVVPAQQQVDDGWYCGTANAVFQNLHLLREAKAKHVLILAGDHVYKMDYSRMLADHINHGAEVTVACIEAPINEAQGYGVMRVDASRRITSFEEKPTHPETIPSDPNRVLASMGIYLFNAALLYEELERDASNPNSSHDFGRDVIPYLVAKYPVHAHRYVDSCVNMVGDRPYWRDVGTVDAYWEANMDLIQIVPELNLYDDDWPIRSLQYQLPPAKFLFDSGDRRGTALDSLISSGCIVSGATVRRSVLFSKVSVAEHSLVEDSVLLPNVKVGRHVTLKRVIVDKGCTLPDGFKAGVYPEEDRGHFHVTERGVTLITYDMLNQGVRSSGGA